MTICHFNASAIRSSYISFFALADIQNTFRRTDFRVRIFATRFATWSTFQELFIHRTTIWRLKSWILKLQLVTSLLNSYSLAVIATIHIKKLQLILMANYFLSVINFTLITWYEQSISYYFLIVIFLIFWRIM